MQVFSSTIIPTINRSTLSRAVQSVLSQDFDEEDFEVIVVNDSGTPLPDMEWMHSRRVQVIDTNRHERSVARNTGASIARGRYFHFLDDDDILLPGALRAFWELDQRRENSIWLNCSYQSADNYGTVIETIHPEINGNNFAMLVAGEGIPLQASLLDSKHFFLVGCFDPKITGVEDRDLGRRFAMAGTICHNNTVVAQIRIGMVGSTTNWSTLAEGDRSSRENALNLHDSFFRVWASAKTCRWHGQIRRNYWHGRLFRAYIASMIWNLQRGNLLKAIGRGVLALALMNLRLFTVDFWKGTKSIDILAGLHLPQTIPPMSNPMQSGQIPFIEDESQ
jgi:glycosyltransferase involved in cell wall biosynthesis